MSGKALKTIYANVFQPEPGKPEPDYRVRRFQTLAAASLKSDDAKRDFKNYLTELNDGADPELTDDQLAAFFWLMLADQNSHTVKPWDDTGVELW